MRRYLRKLVEKSYTRYMSNVTHIAHTDQAHAAQGEYLWSLLDAERWTFRKLEARTGIKVGVISSRMRGVTPLTISEVATFAEVLGKDPVQLYSEIIAHSAPTPPNLRTLVPKVAGSIPVGGTLISFPRVQRASPARTTIAPVIPFGREA